MRAHRVIAALAGVAAVALPAASASAETVVVTEHATFDFSIPFDGPCDASPGVLTATVDEVFHITATGTGFQLTSTQRGSFVFDPDAEGEPSVTGHYTLLHHERVNFGQLKDYRVTDSTRGVGTADDGTKLAFTISTTTLYSADGDVTVKFDSIRCDGRLIE
jgi:hypothetical protein